MLCWKPRRGSAWVSSRERAGAAAGGGRSERPEGLEPCPGRVRVPAAPGPPDPASAAALPAGRCRARAAGPGGSGAAPGRGGRHSWAVESRAGRAPGPGRARRPRLAGLGRRCQVSAGRLRGAPAPQGRQRCRRDGPPDPGCIPPASCPLPSAVPQPLPACPKKEDPGLLERRQRSAGKVVRVWSAVGSGAVLCWLAFAPFWFNSAVQCLWIPCLRVRSSLWSERWCSLAALLCFKITTCVSPLMIPLS